jgi:hypothetical protein
MKELSKNLLYASYRPLSKINTRFFSHFFTNLGYFVKNEAFYNSMQAPEVEDRIVMHNMLSTQYVGADTNICFLEFGVCKGETFAIWVKNNKNAGSRFTGFDTFEGLPEDWGNIKKGAYSANGRLPDIQDSRIDFKVGLIQDTLPGFTKSLSKGVKKVIHIDVDLYNATLISLVHMQPFLEKGDVIIFDDFFTVTKAAHEYRAFCDFLSLYDVQYKPVVKCRRGHVAIEIL